MTWKTVAMWVLALVLMAPVLTGCGSNNLPAEATLAIAALPRAMKGYELYSWQAAGAWHYTLITGTNRIKTVAEVTSAANTVTDDGWVKITVSGTEALKALLARLARGTNVSWLGEGWPLGEPVAGEPIGLPGAGVVAEIAAHCAQLGLTLGVPDLR